MQSGARLPWGPPPISQPTKYEIGLNLSPPHSKRDVASRGIRREIDSLVEDFFRRPPSSTRRRSFLHIASRRARAAFGAIPAVHFTETDRAYEITSGLPSGMDEKNVEVKFAKGVLTIKGEKQEEREEKKKKKKKKTFQVPEGIDTDKIRTRFMKGVLAVTLPKDAEAQVERKVAVMFQQRAANWKSLQAIAAAFFSFARRRAAL